MHPLHDYVATQLADKFKSKGVVVWYDERAEFQAFVDEVRGGPRIAGEPLSVVLAGAKATLAEYAGSMFELRAVVEPQVSGDRPSSVVIYVPGIARDRRSSVLMELEKAGTTWEPQLKQLARNVLRQKYTLGVVDEMLPLDRNVTYEDLARAAAGSGAEPPSILKSIFHDASGNDGLLTAWLVSDARDPEIVSKEATRELAKLAKARLGLDLDAGAPLAKSRSVTSRYVLGGEFRLDLLCDPPASLDAVPRPATKDDEQAVRDLAKRLRTQFPDAYPRIADRVEAELSLAAARLQPGTLGAIDTFRFEERELLRHAAELVTAGKFDEAVALVTEREHSFWLDRDVGRKAQWEAVRHMAELGRLTLQVRSEVPKAQADSAAWVEAYTRKDGWHRLDMAQRRLEAWVANLDDEPDERPLAVVRRAYEEACDAVSSAFSRALVHSGWAVPGKLPQTRIWSEFVAGQPTPVAYFLVDAMRFEMGVELAERLPKSSEVSVRPAIASLPTITPIGMAALLPGAAASFTVVEQNGKLGAQIEGAFLPDLTARRKFAASRVPQLIDMSLDELLGILPSKLARKVDDARIIVVRSQEIDHAGEAGFTFHARQAMNSVIDNIARAIRKLAAAGIERSVVTADHGHLFLPSDREASMRIDAPGGQTVDLHRRCWIGRGGATPGGSVRVAASALGYASDLDVVFPTGSAVFKAGGDLAYHHGGPSLQELVIPVLTVRTQAASPTARAEERPIAVTEAPSAVTNRIFSIKVGMAAQTLSLFSKTLVVRPLLISDGKQVGAVGMVIDAEFDSAAGTVAIGAEKPAGIAFLLQDDTVQSLRIVIQDPATDAELYRSPAEILVRLGV